MHFNDAADLSTNTIEYPNAAVAVIHSAIVDYLQMLAFGMVLFGSLMVIAYFIDRETRIAHRAGHVSFLMGRSRRN